jgi:hypothetical protein
VTTDNDSISLEKDSLDLSKLSFTSLESEAIEPTDQSEDQSIETAKAVEPEGFSAPNQILVGFYSNVKRKDVERFIRSRAESKMSLKTAWYSIIKYDDGFAWELHDGGSGRGALKSIAQLLETNTHVIIKLSNETIKVTRRTNHSGLVSFRIPDSEDSEESSEIVYADKMKPVIKRGLGLFVTGIVFAFLGITSIFLASLFKFVLLAENEPYQHAKQITELPIYQIDRLEQVIALEGVFIQSLSFNNGKWQVNTGSEEPQTAPEPTVDQESDNEESVNSDMVNLSRRIDNSNVNNASGLPPEIESELNGNQ